MKIHCIVQRPRSVLVSGLFIWTYLSGFIDFFFTFRFCFFAEEAERIMKEEYSILQLPAGIPDFKSIEEARLKAEGKSS